MNQGTKWVLLMRKNSSKKSRASVPLRQKRMYNPHVHFKH
jgi:hypothetical protein